MLVYNEVSVSEVPHTNFYLKNLSGKVLLGIFFFIKKLKNLKNSMESIDPTDGA